MKILANEHEVELQIYPLNSLLLEHTQDFLNSLLTSRR